MPACLPPCPSACLLPTPPGLPRDALRRHGGLRGARRRVHGRRQHRWAGACLAELGAARAPAPRAPLTQRLACDSRAGEKYQAAANAAADFLAVDAAMGRQASVPQRDADLLHLTHKYVGAAQGPAKAAALRELSAEVRREGAQGPGHGPGCIAGPGAASASSAPQQCVARRAAAVGAASGKERVGGCLSPAPRMAAASLADIPPRGGGRGRARRRGVPAGPQRGAGAAARAARRRRARAAARRRAGSRGPC